MDYDDTDLQPADTSDHLELTCPACDALLDNDDIYARYHVCGACGRHFSMPARDRARLLVDDGTFRELQDTPESFDLLEHDRVPALDRITTQYERPLLDDAIITGTGTIAGNAVMLIVLDDLLVSAHVGALGAEKIIVALERSLARHLPVVCVAAGGSGSVLSGPLALVQGQRIASVASRLQADDVPMIAVLTHPTSAAVFNSVASLCDVIFAEPGTAVGTLWASGGSLDAMSHFVDENALRDCGWIDGVVSRVDLRDRVAALVALLTGHDVGRLPAGTSPLPTDLNRPVADYLDAMVSPFVELRGDRVDSDERQVVCGIGRLDDMPIAIAVQDAREPIQRDSAAVLRKLQRLARVAGRFEMPLIMLVDGPESNAPLQVSPGDSFAAAKLSATLAVLPVPVVSVGCGRVQGLVSNMMMTGDRRVMLESATYRISSAPQRLGRFPGGGVRGQSWTAREAERMNLIDGVIGEPAAGARDDPWKAARMLGDEVATIVVDLQKIGPRRLTEIRHQLHGLFEEQEDTHAPLGLDVPEWQDVQQSVARSFEDFREKLEHRLASQPRLSLQRPDLTDIAARLKSAQEELKSDLRERASRFDRSNSNE